MTGCQLEPAHLHVKRPQTSSALTSSQTSSPEPFFRTFFLCLFNPLHLLLVCMGLWFFPATSAQFLPACPCASAKQIARLFPCQALFLRHPSPAFPLYLQTICRCLLYGFSKSFDHAFPVCLQAMCICFVKGTQYVHSQIVLKGSMNPALNDLLHRTGAFVREIAYLPLAEDIPIAFNSCRKGPRALGWRDDRPAELTWIECQASPTFASPACSHAPSDTTGISCPSRRSAAANALMHSNLRLAELRAE